MRRVLALLISCIASTFLFTSALQAQNCGNNWASFGPGSHITVGDLDISGQQFTIEAEFTRTTPFPTLYNGGDLVSKHTYPGDVNYLLRPNLTALTTDAGYYEVKTDCPIQLNVRYHAAVVYDGSTLKLYRDGQLMAQTAARGNPFQQDLLTRIGYYSPEQTPEDFVGYINEVRIWKVARSQTEIQANMFMPLANPTTQIGLAAYYTFDNVINKQGDATWNATPGVGVQLNQTDPFCAITTTTVNYPVGTITGSSTCNGAPGLLTFHSQLSAPGPYTINYTDGVQNYTETNVMGGVPFPVKVQPAVATTYTLVSVNGLMDCSPPSQATVKPGSCTLCTGSLGDPILNGTFGSGPGNAPPLATVIPGASTNLAFQQTNGNPALPTPQDGFYTISNNVPYNGNQNWHSGGKDHTGDPNGYMLFENPGTTPGEFFRQKVTGLCNGGKYEFAAWVAEADNPASVQNPILPDLTFIVQTEDGTVLDTYNSGLVPALSTWTWHHYGFFFTLPPGISTAIVRILDNNPGGYALPGNDFALDDITFRPCGPAVTAALTAGSPAVICTGGSSSLTATVNGGYASPSYIWQVSADSGKTWTDVPNSNGTQLTVTPAAVNKAIDFYYRILTAEASNIQSSSCRVASIPVSLTVNPTANTDFGFEQLACTPKEIQFTGSPSPGTTYSWNIDGTDQSPTGIANPLLDYVFGDYGDHVITLKASALCPGSTTKTITVALTPAEILLTPDSVICAGKSVALKTKGELNFCWSPTTDLSDPTSANPTASPAAKIKYQFTSLITGQNLIINGDFSSGQVGFTSEYTFATNGFPESTYGIGTNSAAWLPNSPPCKDHTTGAGNMLLVNGSSRAGVSVWSETVTVTPNTNYAFSAWLDNITTVNPALLLFVVNGHPIGKPLTANVNSCIWDQFHTMWNSGAATQAVISIVNANTGTTGNDFALDDISFAPVNMQTDSVTIDVETPFVTATPSTSTICPDIPLQLQASGSDSYSWTPTTGLDNPFIASPVSLLPSSPTGNIQTYTVTGTSARGCNATASVLVTQLPRMVTLGTADPLICKGDAAQLYSTGGGTYSWSPASLLDDPSSATPAARPDVTTKFYLTLTDLNQCREEDSLTVQVRPVPVYKAPEDETVCEGHQVKLISQNAPGYVYAWTPPTGLDDPSAPYPEAGPTTTLTYGLHIRDSACPAYKVDFTVRVVVRPSPVITAEKENDIDCSIHTTLLHANGGIYYTWFPEQGLNSPTTPSPIASIDTTTTYVVRGTGSNGCSAYDTLTVYVTATGANTFVVPNAFTPNGDGHNDCFGVVRWGYIQLQELAVYDRWGTRVFSTRNPSECWDGRFRGQLQPPGTYAYVIKARTFCGEFTRTGAVLLIR